MGRPFSARNARVSIRHDGVVTHLLASRVTVHTNADRIDVTNFESGTDAATGLFYGDYIGGVTSATVNIEAYDSDASVDDGINKDPWLSGLKAGINEGEMYIFVFTKTSTLYAWYFPSITVIDVSSEAEAHGAVKHMLQVMNRGRFYYPGEVTANKPAAF